MSVVKGRPIDSLQHVITSFKQFEKKLDQLQDDVAFQCQTLSELRGMVANISNVNISPDLKSDEIRRPPIKTTTMEAEDDLNGSKIRRKNAMQPLSVKSTKNNFQSTKYNIKSTQEPFRSPKISTSPNIYAYKRTPRPRKREIPRKPTVLKPKDSKKSRKKSPSKTA